MKYKAEIKHEMVKIELTRQEAVVLHDFLIRESENEHMYRDKSEQLTLWKIEGQLDNMLEEPFMENYAELLENARKTIKERFLKHGE